MKRHIDKSSLVFLLALSGLMVACQNGDGGPLHEDGGPFRSVSITSPKCGESFNCESTRYDAIRDKKQCFFTVSGSASNLQDGDYLSLFLKISGGGKWWQSGNSLKYEDDFEGDWTVSMVSVDLNGISQSFSAKAIISKQSYPSGKTHSQLPDNVAKSDGVCKWTLQQ